MTTRTSVNWVNIALVAGGVYLAWKYLLPALSSVSSGVASAASGTSSAIADAINYMTGVSAPSAQPLTGGRGVNMPGNGVVPLSSFTNVSPSSDGTYLFGVYQGTMYSISGPLDANGNYTAS